MGNCHSRASVLATARVVPQGSTLVREIGFIVTTSRRSGRRAMQTLRRRGPPETRDITCVCRATHLKIERFAAR